MNRKQRRATQKAVSTPTRATFENEASIQSLFKAGFLAHQVGDLARAEALYRQVLGIAPHHVDSLHRLGVVAQQRGQSDVAVSLINQALAIKPDFADAHLNLGIAYKTLGKIEQAIHCYQTALFYRKAFPEALVNLGNIFKAQGKTPDAVDYYCRALNVRPNYPEAHNLLGVALALQGKADDAETSYHTALKLRPFYWDAYGNLGNLYKARGNLELAALCFKAAIACRPDVTEFYSGLGGVRFQQDHLSEAASALRKGILCNPEFVEAQCNLAVVLNAIAEHGEQAEALLLAKEWVCNFPHHAIAVHTQAGLGGDKPTSRADNQYIKTLFDTFAPTFDASLAALQYQTPALIGKVLKCELVPRGDLDVLDAGCGTGLMGEALRPYARRLLGIDLSSSMLERAQRTAWYDDLEESEVTAFLKAHLSSFDLVVAADVLVYFGDLTEFMTAVAGSLRPSGQLIFTVEQADDVDEGWHLNPSGRYAHSQQAVRRAVESAGLVFAQCDKVVLRHEFGRPVQGFLIIVAPAQKRTDGL